MAWPLISAVEATYLLATESPRRARGSCRPTGPLERARVTSAAEAGSRARNLPLTTVAQQYSSRSGASRAWSAIVCTFFVAARIEPSGSGVGDGVDVPIVEGEARSPSGATTFR